MKDINTQFNYLNLEQNFKYDYLDKQKNTINNIWYMFNRSNIMFKYHGLPDSIPERELEKQLQTSGYTVFFKYGENIYCNVAGLGGDEDVYNRPTQAIITIPALNYNDTLNIDENCVLMLNDSMGQGLTPLYSKYCNLINESEITILLTLVNDRIQHFISASDDNTIKSAEKYLKNIFDGKLGVVAETKLFESLKVNEQHVNGASLKELIEMNQYLRGMLFNEIGLESEWNLKRERLNVAEVESNSSHLYPLVDDMLQNRRDGVEKLNEIYGLNVKVELNSSWDYRIFNGASIHNTDEETQETDEETQETQETDEETQETDEETQETQETDEKEKVNK